MKYIIVCGSHRENSQSLKVSQYLKSQLTAKGHQGEIIELAALLKKMPLWEQPSEENVPTGHQHWNQHVSPILEKADAFIIVSPEYSGMVPAALKNFFLMVTKGELSHKPALIVGVSAGQGGAYPIVELRMSSYKNSFLCYIPDHLIVRNVNTVLNSVDEAGSEAENSLRQRIDYTLDILAQYSHALKSVRASGVVNLKKYPFGVS